MLLRSALLAPVSVLLVAGCGHAATPATVASAPTHVVVAPPPPRPAALAEGAIRRSTIRSVVEAGFGAFLQKVSVDDQPVFVGGRFHGFRIASLEAESFRGVDLRPGDVVIRVDGMSIEHPEEAILAFNALPVASELRVDYERDGVARSLRYQIIDDEAPATPKRAK